MVQVATKRACCYIRVSGKRQADEGYSLEEQQEAIRRYCELNNCDLIDIYIDAGISGRKVYRPQFNLMLDAIRANSYDVVVVWRLDRATRKPSLGYKLKDALDATHTEIVSLTEGYIQNRFMYAIALAMAEEESEKRSERAKLGSAGRAKKGKVVGVVKYGYCVDENGMPQIYEPEASVVRRIFSEYLNGKRVGQVANGLNDDGIPTKFGNTWDGVAVSKVFDSTQYAGYSYAMRQFKQLVDNGERDIVHTYWRDKSDWIKQEYPAIVDPKTWERAQEIKSVSRGLRASKGYKVPFLLRHLVWCESCGCRFHPLSYQHKTKKKQPDGSFKQFKVGGENRYRTYECLHGRTKKSICPRPRISAIQLEKIVWDKVTELIENPDLVRLMIDERRDELENRGTLADFEKLRSKLESIETERQRTVLSFTKGYIDETELDVKMKSINERKEMIEFELVEMEQSVGEYDSQVEALKSFSLVSSAVRGRLSNLNDDERKELVCALVSKVTIGEEINLKMAIGQAPRIDGSTETHQGTSERARRHHRVHGSFIWNSERIEGKAFRGRPEIEKEEVEVS